MARKQPLHSQLYEVMAGRIHSGVWKEGDRVPSESALIEEFGTSRGPVRQALARLRAEGMLVGGRGSRPRVQRPVPSQSFDVYLSFTEWAEDLGRVPGQKTVEVSRRLADQQIARELGVPEHSPVVSVSRLRLFDGEPVMFERSVYRIEAGEHLLAEDLDRRSIYQILRERDIYPTQARNVIDAVAAEPLEARWLEVKPGSPLLRVRRIAFDQQGSVIDSTDNRYLPGKATLAVENTRSKRSPLTRHTVDDG